jgi:glycerophosphoryl diester phosphodiesterase
MASRYLAATAPRGLWVIAHRGCSGTCPENTMASFSAAVEANADFIELDVHLTSDGEVVVIHDGDIGRTTNGKGRVAQMTLAEIGKYDAGSWKSPRFVGEQIPSLREVLDLIPIGIKIEIKAEGRQIGRQVLELVRNADAMDRVVISSFNESTLVCLAEMGPEAERLWLGGFDVDRVPTLTTLSGPDHNDANMTQQYVDAMHAKGIAIWPWTVDTPEEIRRVIGMGVDGIISNWPGRVIQEL